MVFLGEGRIALLKAIEKEGALSKAAKSMKMSYKKAWNLIDAMNKSSSTPVVITSTGGAGGGGAKLSDYGKQKINQFEEVKKNCWEFMETQNQLLNN